MGLGSPKREFLHSEDLAEAVMVAAEKYDDNEHINVGTGEELSIRELAELISMKSGYEGRLNWDSTKPDGTPRKVLDSEKMKKLGWRPKISLTEGVERTVSWFRANSG